MSMSEITQQKIFEKLQQLDGYLSNLKKLKKEIKSPEEFLESISIFVGKIRTFQAF